MSHHVSLSDRFSWLISAFPTALEVIPETWTWDGVLSTVDAYGASACVTVESSTISMNVTSLPRQTTMPIAGGEDPRGWNYVREDTVLGTKPLQGIDAANQAAFFLFAIIAPLLDWLPRCSARKWSLRFDSVRKWDWVKRKQCVTSLIEMQVLRCRFLELQGRDCYSWSAFDGYR